MKQSMTALVVTLFALGSVGVFAQPGEQDSDPLQQHQQQGGQADIQGKEFSELDTDQDGNVNETEAQEAGIETVAFDAMDSDKDQQVSEEEFDQAKEQGATR